MFEKPRFKSKFRVEALSSTELLLLQNNQDPHLLSGRVYVALVPFLKRGACLDAIYAQLEKKFSSAEILYALMRLAEKGYIEEKEARTVYGFFCLAFGKG